MRIIFCILLFFSGLTPCWAQFNDLGLQRAEFSQAKTALQQKDYAKYFLLSNLLHNYPLYPYLRYAELSQHMDRISASQVTDFLHVYADTPLAERMRMAWLQILAKQQRWPLFLKYYQPVDDASLQCNYLHALAANGQTQIAYQQVKQLWLVGNAQPETCQAIFTAWQKNGGLTDQLIWQRLALAMAINNQTLVHTLLLQLPVAQQNEARLWQKIYLNPLLVNQPQLFATKELHTQEILIDGITRLAHQNPALAVKLWPSLRAEYHFNDAESQTIIHAIAIDLARNADPAASAWLAALKPAYADNLALVWRVRTALAQLNWIEVTRGIMQLPLTERNAACWRYWQARAQAAEGHTQVAHATFTSLAPQLNYYGLLASQQLQQPYRPNNSSYFISDQLLQQVALLPAMQRAHELYLLQYTADARREWQWGIRHMSKLQLLAAAELAKRWGWYDRAIMTADKAGEESNIDLRFPLAYRTLVLNAAQQTGLDPAWIFAIIHQESSFIPDIKSDAGALGLMQLMPQTGKILADNLNINFADRVLLNPMTNTVLGSHYLKQLLISCNNSKIAASAAYNIGPTRLHKWLPLYKKLPAEVWVAILPWQETREYVENVMLATTIYAQRGG